MKNNPSPCTSEGVSLMSLLTATVSYSSQIPKTCLLLPTALWFQLRRPRPCPSPPSPPSPPLTPAFCSRRRTRSPRRWGPSSTWRLLFWTRTTTSCLWRMTRESAICLMPVTLIKSPLWMICCAASIRSAMGTVALDAGKWLWSLWPSDWKRIEMKR